ncbi:MAG: chemotaxis-specific protein-glutamate methyltransferase CheB [Bdellovibrionota bacterium]
MKVLVIDDAVSFRSQIKKMLNMIDGIEVVGSASNGKIAIDMLQHQDIDLIILDLNMPVMGGLETIEEMRRLGLKQKIIVFASKSSRSARDTVTALSLGANDFVLKPEGIAANLDAVLEQVRAELEPRIIQFIPKKNDIKLDNNNHQSKEENSNQLTQTPQYKPAFRNVNIDIFTPKIIVIASSTGGPKALEVFFSKLTSPPTVPILVAQHMPETFTKFLAQRIAKITGINCREAKNGEFLNPGIVYIAPGNFHMKVTETNTGPAILLDQGPRVNSVRPAADLLFSSATKVFGSQCLGFVLTGMGQDGCLGSYEIKKNGGVIMIQDQKSSTVWGMPGEVHQRGYYDKIGSLEQCCEFLTEKAINRKVA